MMIVSDTTVVTTPLKCGNERLLQQLFGAVQTPQAVADELLQFHPRLPEFVVIERVNAEKRLSGTEAIGRGEAEALQLAAESGADLLLTDDKKARQAAKKLGIAVTGLLGLVVEAKKRGHIASVSKLIDKLQQEGGLYLNESVRAEALKLADES